MTNDAAGCSRRQWLALAAAGLSAGCVRWYPDERISNPCLTPPLPPALANHPVLVSAWEGIEPARVWDCHVHIAGIGDTPSGIWINPALKSWLSPLRRAQLRFYLNAACIREGDAVDDQYMARLATLQGVFPAGAKALLMALDWHYDTSGNRDPERTTLHVPDALAARQATQHPDLFEWIASVHPYREDCVQALDEAARQGACAVKWLPPAMGINPGSPACDRFYEAMARLGLPLLTHGGSEYAVAGEEFQFLGNPLLLRRALDHGVRVIVAHCASLGESLDLDHGPDGGPKRANFELFLRLMEEPRYEGLLFGELSAMLLINHGIAPLEALLMRSDLHHRLINGSDYPLPGIMPLYLLRYLVSRGLLSEATARYCGALRLHNPLLADFVIKRHLTYSGKRFSAAVFESAYLFDNGKARAV